MSDGHADNATNKNIIETLTLRDFFAAKAMQGKLACYHACNVEPGETSEQSLAKRCYVIADAILKAREEEDGDNS